MGILPYVNLQDQSFTVFDIETTGLDPRASHRIVEIGAVRIGGGRIDSSHTFHSLVNPERPVPKEAERIHGIQTKELQSSPTSMEVIPLFLSFASSSILVAHNAPFDLSFLSVEKDSCWGYVELPECLCTLEFSKHLFPKEARHHLDAVASRLGLPAPAGRHRALSDARLTAEVFLRLLSKSNVRTLDELRRLASVATLCR